MSNEGGVIPSDMVRNDIMPQELTSVVGKGALGAWRALKRHSFGL